MDSLADPSSMGDVDENDPKSVARWMKKMGSEMGEDLGDDWGDSVDEAMDGRGGWRLGDPFRGRERRPLIDLPPNLPGAPARPNGGYIGGPPTDCLAASRAASGAR